MSYYNVDAERAIISKMFRSNESISDIIQRISERDFYDLKNRIIFKEMVSLFSLGQIVDPINVISKIRGEAKTEISDYIDTSIMKCFYEDIDSYIDSVKENSIYRSSLKIGDQINEMIDYGQSSFEIINFIEGKLKEFNNKLASGDDIVSSHVSMKNALDGLMQTWDNDTTIYGIPSGFQSLDYFTHGFQDSTLVVLAARPGIGKTTMAINMLSHISSVLKVPALFFSLEMSCTEIALKIISSNAKINSYDLKKCNLDNESWGKIGEILTYFEDVPLYIDESSDIDPIKIKAKIRKMIYDKGIKIVFIDYLQLIKNDGKRLNPFERISEIVVQLKKMAKEFKIPIVVLSQLSRDVEKRQENYDTKLSDLRGSGEIEQTADIVLFIERDYYDNSSNEAVLKIAKHRAGELGEIKLFFHKGYGKFYENK